MDGAAAPPQGARHLRPHQLPRRKAEVPAGHAALPRLCAQRGDALPRACAAHAASGRIAMKAMILAAGRGERLPPLTDRVPKPLLEAGASTPTAPGPST